MAQKKEKETLQIKVTLTGDMIRRFQAIKKRYGLESNADVVRLLITLEYEKIASRRE